MKSVAVVLDRRIHDDEFVSVGTRVFVVQADGVTDLVNHVALVEAPSVILSDMYHFGTARK